MSSPLPVKHTRPKKDFTTITQLGLKAHHLAVTYKAEIDTRLPGTIDALGDDLDAMGVVVPGAAQARHEAMAATAAQNALVLLGYARVRSIRQTIRKSGAPKDIQRAYGVGQKTSAIRVRHVIAALQQIVDRATGAPQEAASFGLISADVGALQDFITQLTDADMTQEKMRANAPLSTRERNMTGHRILQAVALIAGAGRIAFADNPPVHASFEALLTGSKRTAPKPKKTAGPPRTPESMPSAASPAPA